MFADWSDTMAFRPALTTSSTDSLEGRNVTTGIAPYEIDDAQYSPCTSPTYLHDSEVYVLQRRSSTPAVKDAENEPPKPPLNLSNFFRPLETAWPTPPRNFEAHGWVKYTLTDNSVYFHHPILCVTADVDLRDLDKLTATMTLLNKSDGEWALPLDQWELWLRDVETSEDGCFPARAWVHHTARIVSFDESPLGPGKTDIPENQSRFVSFCYHFLTADVVPLVLRARDGSPLLAVRRGTPCTCTTASKRDIGSH